ncbi:MAG: NADH-quinone oxidoreductase subunit L [Candidatus Eremiobacteraeota bacterium]|nr:NADH-quinone oxidoreductase subunit L [Candidatus Eremiobacteraeota bacterium]
MNGLVLHHTMGVDGSYPLLLVILLAPLLGAIVNWTFGPQLKRSAGWIGCLALAVSFVATAVSWGAATQNNGAATGAHQHLLTWMPGFDFGLLLDPLSLLWVFIITGVGFLIHLYSVGYMYGDKAFARFFAYLNFFVFAMLLLVLSDNFAGLLVGWGLVGLASYFLIGFWFFKPTAVAAARKAFVLNVVGDVGIMLAIFLIFTRIGSVTYGDTFANVPMLGNWLFLVCLCLFIGCAAKSAQIPLHTWLPDAMEGPTPVSALIHAATMVTAGVYLIARCWPLWSASADAQELAGAIGALTAFTGALLGIAQWDIKRILAYSTMSQIGYMIMGVGVGAYEGGVAHFFTHAFFKACLFLGSGIVIHALGDEQDIRLMGGMRTRTPLAFWSMFAAVLAICGVPLFSGFFSKDAIIQGALEHGHPWVYVVDIITAGITAYYMFRLFFVTFFGEYRGSYDPADLGITHPEMAGVTLATGATVSHEPAEAHAEEDHAQHAPDWIMGAPVAILGVFSIIAGYLLVGGANSPWHKFFSTTFPHERVMEAPIPELVTSLIVFVVVLAGIAIAYRRYGTRGALADAPARLREESIRMPAALTRLFYFDDAIEFLFVKPAQLLGQFIGRVFDPHVIDGAVREVVFTSRWLGTLVRSFQTGLLRAYAIMIVFGAACFAAYYALVGGR